MNAFIESAHKSYWFWTHSYVFYSVYSQMCSWIRSKCWMWSY